MLCFIKADYLKGCIFKCWSIYKVYIKLRFIILYFKSVIVTNTDSVDIYLRLTLILFLSPAQKLRQAQ